MQKNRNGIRVQTPRKHSKKRRPLNIELGRRKYMKHIDGVEVVVNVPHFSPIIEVMNEDGWREIG